MVYMAAKATKVNIGLVDFIMTDSSFFNVSDLF